MHTKIFISFAAAVIIALAIAALVSSTSPATTEPSASVGSSGTWMSVSAPAFTLRRAPVTQSACVDPLAHVRRRA